ncbi:MAG: hypothetical protein CHACPFDD_03590 [Phycisphaerae bacterium]|nr:hypothetical protein [Phycisphaerae bacterium]
MNDLLRLLAACVAGGIIGFEREVHDKPAGLRTNVMICLGAALFAIVSIRFSAGVDGASGDPARIAAQVVTGVGFLGAGAIIQARGGAVLGLTTAATIWTVASIGLAFGAGRFGLGAVATAIACGILFGLSRVEQRIARWRTTDHLEVLTQAAADSERLMAYSRTCGVELRMRYASKVESGYSFHLRVSGPKAAIDGFTAGLIAEPYVIQMREA